ncbi:hypothetical protein QFZ97_006518 [Paraburkholderia youngii]
MPGIGKQVRVVARIVGQSSQASARHIPPFETGDCAGCTLAERLFDGSKLAWVKQRPIVAIVEPE